MKGLFKTIFVSLSLLLFFNDTFAQTKDKLDLSKELPAEATSYLNYAIKGSYENETWLGEVPEWHYFDMFGNKLLDGFYLYGLGMKRNSLGGGQSMVALHPFLKKWFNGLVTVGDLGETGGVLAIIGDRVKTLFTPLSLDQSLYAGTRFDAFYLDYNVSLLTSRISNTGTYGMTTDKSVAVPEADWLHGIQVGKKFGELAAVGATAINVHHEMGKNTSNPFSGVDTDTLHPNTPSGISVYGLNFNLTLENPNLKAYGEYKQSQEFLDGTFRPKPGNAALLNTHWDIFERLRCGGECYVVDSRFKTSFSCPVDTLGDLFGCGKYLYALVEDNDDNDDYPENGKSKLPSVPVGDIDGVVPVKYDKNKNGILDFEEDFLSYDSDAPQTGLFFDRNNNGIADELEDDAYPDYPYVPSYYKSGERYIRYYDLDKTSKEDTSDGLVSKGLMGFHLFSRFEPFQKLNVTLGGIYDKSEKNSYQKIYVDTVAVGEGFDPEKSTTVYFLAQFKKDLERDMSVTVTNFTRKINDNIPNHTQSFNTEDPEAITYHPIIDELDYRDALISAFIAELSMFKNRGFSFTSRGKYEFTKNFPHLNYNYPGVTISALTFVDKCQYIYLLPVLKDMFLIPQYKNICGIKEYGPRYKRLDDKYRSCTMINNIDVVYQWKITEKTAISLGGQLKRFDDFFDRTETYNQQNFSFQALIRDRYLGLSMVLTTGLSFYRYAYSVSGKPHDPLNNPHRVKDNITAHNIFVKIHCGF